MPVRALVSRENPDLSAGHLLLVYGDGLADVIDLALHLPDLRGLQVQHLQEVVSQRVDLVGDTGQALGGVPLGLLQRGPLVVALKMFGELRSLQTDY